MSRGAGWTMIAVEAHLSPERRTIHDLAARVYGVHSVTRAQVEAVRRACKRLAQLDRAELQRRQAYELGRWGRGSNQRFLTARSPLTAEEREQVRERQRLQGTQAKR